MTVEYRTVLVSADCAARFDAAVESGVELARALQLGLAGLFVEEEALLDFSAFPFSRVIQTGRSGARELDRETMRRALEREGLRLRAELSRRAEQLNIRWRFDIGRGRSHEAISRAAQEGDIVVLPTALSQSDARARLDIARELLAQGRAALLAPAMSARADGAVLALIEGPGRAAALALAATIASRLETRLVVHAWPQAADEAAAIERRMDEIREGLRAVDLNLRSREEALDARIFDAPSPRLIVAQWSFYERLALIGPQMALHPKAAGLLLLPD